MACNEWLRLISMIRVETKGNLYKPALLLAGLGRVAAHKENLARFAYYERVLSRVLTRYGNARTRTEVALPYWHLRSDGLWQVVGPDNCEWTDTTPLEVGRVHGKTRPVMGELRRTVGGLPDAMVDDLRQNESCLQRCINEVSQYIDPDDRLAVLEDLGLGTFASASASQVQEIADLSGVPAEALPPLLSGHANRAIEALKNGAMITIARRDGTPINLAASKPRQSTPATPATPDELSEISRLSGVDLPPDLPTVEAQRILAKLTANESIGTVGVLLEPRDTSQREPSQAQRDHLKTYAKVTNVHLTEREATEALALLESGRVWVSHDGARSLEPLPPTHRPAEPTQIDSLRKLTGRRFNAAEVTSAEADRAIDDLTTHGRAKALLTNGDTVTLVDVRHPGHGSPMPDQRETASLRSSESLGFGPRTSAWDDYRCRSCGRQFRGPLHDYTCARCRTTAEGPPSESDIRHSAKRSIAFSESSFGRTVDDGHWIGFEVPRMNMMLAISLRVETPVSLPAQIRYLSPFGDLLAVGDFAEQELTISPVSSLEVGPVLVLAFHDGVEGVLLATGPARIREIYAAGDGVSTLALVNRAPHRRNDLVSANPPERDPDNIVNPYVEWQPVEPVQDPASAVRQDLADALVALIEVEGPVTGRRILECIRENLGVRRLRPPQKSAINRVLHQMVRSGTILGEAGFSDAPMLTTTFRIPNESPVLARALGPRRVREVPPSEIRHVASKLSGNDGSASEASVIEALGGELDRASAKYVQRCVAEDS